jgi:DNA (cytosine-5)-methyltransferase 1
MVGKAKLKVVDLFCGCGGFSHGFQKAGFEVVLGVDWNADAIETFKLNHKKAQYYAGPIEKLTNQKINQMLAGQKIDVVIGGPPCQGFSTVGQGKKEDPRNFLFKEFVRIVKLLKPRMIVLENVTGLLAEKNKNVLNNIFRSFTRLGYQMDAKVLQAENFGVPSHRRRTFIIGCLVGKGLESAWPRETHGLLAGKKLKTIGEAWRVLQKKKTFQQHDIEKAKLKNQLDIKRLKYIPEGQGIRYQKNELDFLPKKLRYNIAWEMLPEKRFRQTKLQRLDRKKVSPTILTSRTSYIHPTEPRYLTPREAALCQSFPENFKFYGSVTSVFRQIGNAVPPLLAYRLAKNISSHIQRVPSVSKVLKKVKNQQVQELRKSAFIYRVKQ